MRFRASLAKLGVEISAFAGSFQEHRLALIQELGVATVWDVGAHVGQYGQALRSKGYTGRIVSVEPDPAVFIELRRTAGQDPDWLCERAAVSDSAGEGLLNVSANGQSSSLHTMLQLHREAAPYSAPVRVEAVPLVRLDDLLEQYSPPPPFCLKLDVQGAEIAAIRGGARALDKAVVCEVELSLAPLYEGGSDWIEVVTALDQRGLRLCDLDRVFFDRRSGDLLQVNGLFRTGR